MPDTQTLSLFHYIGFSLFLFTFHSLSFPSLLVSLQLNTSFILFSHLHFVLYLFLTFPFFLPLSSSLNSSPLCLLHYLFLLALFLSLSLSLSSSLSHFRNLNFRSLSLSLYPLFNSLYLSSFHSFLIFFSNSLSLSLSPLFIYFSLSSFFSLSLNLIFYSNVFNFCPHILCFFFFQFFFRPFCLHPFLPHLSLNLSHSFYICLSPAFLYHSLLPFPLSLTFFVSFSLSCLTLFSFSRSLFYFVSHSFFSFLICLSLDITCFASF
ncbi:unnamed protein product [Acanthosepion pharaonis]|uniref:Uncharacterized protein n=1 Tax=Acanthosepion pharaonis TaxID=158019 RepID=A0A812CF35_ACAPH|nr:unnamed protein product [Sepia pharaonis]